MRINRHLFSQTSFYALVGCTIGLAVWIAMIWPTYDIWHSGILRDPDIPAKRLQTVLLLYMPMGILMGLCVALIEPIQDTSFLDALRNEWSWALRGLFLGGVAAFLGGWAGEILLASLVENAVNSAKIAPWARILGTLCFGIIFGAGLGLIDRWRTTSNDRFFAGIIGGSLGGAIAAVVFHFLVKSTEVMTVLALLIFAAMIMGAIGSRTFLQTNAVLLGTPDNIFKYSSKAGFRKKLLPDTATFVGSALPTRISGKTNFKIVQDSDVMKEHCMLRYDDKSKRWRLERYEANATELFVNKKRVKDKPVELRDGDILTVGRTSFRFQLER